MQCGGGGLYASFVNTVMAEEDPSRPQWPSNPSEGWVSGVDRLTGLPNGKPLVAKVGGAAEGSRTGGRAARAAAAVADACRRAGGEPSPAALSASAGGACSVGIGAGNCTVVVNADYNTANVNGPVVATADAAACCDACAILV
jgi:hypothetical protein